METHDVWDKAAYDELPDGVVVADETGTVVVVNAAAVRLLGRSVDESDRRSSSARSCRSPT